MARQLTYDIVPGPNGSGKSSISRVLRGLWPAVNGKLIKPYQKLDSESGSHLFYVPQQPYTCLGTLRDQIIYPLSHDEAEKRVVHLVKQGQESIVATNIFDAHLKTILENVKLLYLLEREGGWDACQNWEDILSLGEQQRLGMTDITSTICKARLFFHKPQFGVLDECTNATVEEHLYRLATNLGITVITSSQRPALIPYHALELRLVDGEGKW